MTRINLVDVKDLADQHLMAEWREIKMIPPALRRSILAQQKIYDTIRGNSIMRPEIRVMQKIPASYTMGTGHVTFFYDKLFWLVHRYDELTNELLDRDYQLSDIRNFDTYIVDLPTIFYQSFVATPEEKKVNIDRIVKRLNEKPSFYRYRGEVKPPSFFEERYNQQLIIDALT